MMDHEEKKTSGNVSLHNQHRHYEDNVREEITTYPAERCILCGTHHGSLVFKQKKICIHCLDFVKSN